MVEQRFHSADLSKFQFLVTGGAGFIGSHLVDYLLFHGARKVYVIDNLSTGSISNIERHHENIRFSFIKADINDTDELTRVCVDVDFVLHQAALGSVPRSIKDPLATHNSNATGFLSILEACRLTQVKRLVFASSSSVYGDSPELPKKEDNLGFPKSPYAITKLMDEYYGMLYHRMHKMEVIGLRYFNIFGPRQNPNGPYAAAIPLFILSALSGQNPLIFGDGEQSRDFTFVENAVQANIRALFADSQQVGQIYNIACGAQYTLNSILNLLAEILGQDLKADYKEARVGDIKHSLASIEKAGSIDYKPGVDLKSGLATTVDWYKENR